VVESIADARKVAEAMARKEIPNWKSMDKNFNLGFDRKQQIPEIYNKKGRLTAAQISEDDGVIAENEAERCLECNVICNKCVDVCPNRANVAIEIDKKEGFHDVWQILHLDALCNECGNCGTFCPYNGLPYKDKLTLFTIMEDFKNSTNNGFIVTGAFGSQLITLRLNNNHWTLKLDRDGELIPTGSPYSSGHSISEIREVNAIISTVFKNYSYLINSSWDAE
jgi:putative selenate reductase